MFNWLKKLFNSENSVAEPSTDLSDIAIAMKPATPAKKAAPKKAAPKKRGRPAKK